jgi:integrase
MAELEAPFPFPGDTAATCPVPKVNNAHDRAVEAGKVPKFRLYDLRLTWATRAAESGIDLVTLAALWATQRFRWCSCTPIPRKSIGRGL